MNDFDIIKFISDGFEKAKSGDAINIYNKVARFEEINTIPLKSHYPYGWIITMRFISPPTMKSNQGKKCWHAIFNCN